MFISSSNYKTKKKRKKAIAVCFLFILAFILSGSSYLLIHSTVDAIADTKKEEKVDLSDPKNIKEGALIYAANCATCHGRYAAGTENAPSLIGVGAAAVDFQVGTGRMPMQFNAPQARKKPVQFTNRQIKQLAAWIASLAPGPAIPSREFLEQEANEARGAELFRINCAMCHNVAAAGGALTEGKFAPPLGDVDPVHIYEAMITGPQQMPVFNDLNLSPEDKRDIIASIKWMTKNTSSVGGYPLGSIGPVAEGFFVWIFGITAVLAVAIWLAARPH